MKAEVKMLDKNEWLLFDTKGCAGSDLLSVQLCSYCCISAALMVSLIYVSPHKNSPSYILLEGRKFVDLLLKKGVFFFLSANLLQ